jgi:hypothetical protein
MDYRVTYKTNVNADILKEAQANRYLVNKATVTYDSPRVHHYYKADGSVDKTQAFMFIHDSNTTSTAGTIATSLALEVSNKLEFETQKVGSSSVTVYPKKDSFKTDEKGSSYFASVQAPGTWQLSVKQTEIFADATGNRLGYVEFAKSNGTGFSSESLENSVALTGEKNQYIGSDWGNSDSSVLDSTGKIQKPGFYLNVPVEKQRAGSYEGKLTWTLTDAPGNE